MIHDQKIAFETARYLLQINAIKLNPKNPFQWASGWKSPIYCDNRIALSFPEVRNHLCDQLVDQARMIYGEKFVIAGVATGAIGIGVLVAQAMGLPFLYVRPEPKSHGRKNQIEGKFEIGAKVLVIEDLISTGKSSLGAVKALQDAGAEVLGMLALFTYNFEISNQNFSSAAIPLNTLSDYDHLIKEALSSDYIKQEEMKILQSWRSNPTKWNNNQ
jgi:orotate phosphoribosyltransferase